MNRNWAGWAVLTAFLVFMIGGQLAEYFQRPAAQEGPSLGSIETTLRVTLQSQTLVENAANRDQLREQLARLDRKGNDLAAVELRTVIRGVLGEAPVARDQRRLRQGNRSQRLLAELAAKPKPSRAETLARELPNSPYAYEVARAWSRSQAKETNLYRELYPPTRALLLGAVVLAALGAILTGVGLWIFYFSQRATGALPPLGHPAGELTVERQDQFAWMAGVMLFVFFGAQLVVQLALKDLPTGVLGPLGFGVATVLVLLLPKLTSRDAKIQLPQLGWSREHLGRNVLWGLAAYLANLPLVAVAAGVGSLLSRFLPEASHPATEALQGAVSPDVLIGTFLAAVILAPIVEETMFRGVLLPATLGLFRKPWVGLVLTNFAFAAIHPTGIPAWLALFAVGLTASLVTLQTRSLIPAIVLHAAHNFGTLLLLRVITG